MSFLQERLMKKEELMQKQEELRDHFEAEQKRQQFVGNKTASVSKKKKCVSKSDRPSKRMITDFFSKKS